jgi:hypothetical protein
VSAADAVAAGATTAGATYQWSAWMRANRTGLRGRVVVREFHAGRLLQTRAASADLVRGNWKKVRVGITRLRADSRLSVRVGSPLQRSTDVLLVDDVLASVVATAPAPIASAPAPAPTATTTAAPSPTAATTAPAPTGPTLSNGCAYSRRGVPSCGAFLGSAYGSNTDPAAMETDMGARLGVHRTYFTASQVSSGVSMASKDIAAGRLPWISFKLPYSWDGMVAGQGDAWTKDVATRLAALPGPVWLAFHHESEGDGDIQVWRQMQERLAPIVRSTAPNTAFTVVLTGWNELYGDAQFRLENIWPRTTVDVAGFDVYNKYGVVTNGVMNTTGTNLKTAYFEPLSAWAASKGVAWGIAETGFTDAAAVKYPHWIRDTYQALIGLDGVAFTYFNTTLNSVANWALTTVEKKASYREAASGQPLLPKP